MCKIANTDLGIKRLDFKEHYGKMVAYLTDGRIIILPVSLFPDIQHLTVKQRNKWMILDDQFFTFDDLSIVYSITDLLKL